MLKDKLDYFRGSIDTLMNKDYAFFEPSVTYQLDRNDGSISLENHFNVRYTMSSTSPSATYLIDYRDDSTPLVVRLGNPDLQSTRKHEAELSFSSSRWKKQTYLYFIVRYSLWERALSQAVEYDALTGTRTYKPENIDGNWGVYSQLQWNCALDKNKRWKFTTRTSMDYRHNVDYASFEQTASSIRSSVDRIVTQQGINVGYAHNYYSIWASANMEWTHSKSVRFGKRDAFNVNYRISGGVPLPGGFQVGTNLTLYSRYGYSSDLFNSNQVIWSANLSRSFLRGLMKVELEAFDILNKMSGHYYAINAQMQTESYYNVLRRYLMLNLTFRLNKEPKKR